MSDTPDVLDALTEVLVFAAERGVSATDLLRVTGTQDAPTFNQEPVWRRLRRSVPENGDT